MVALSHGSSQYLHDQLNRLTMAQPMILTICGYLSYHTLQYERLDTVNSKSFVSKVLLRIKWKFELTVHYKHEIIEKTIHRKFELSGTSN